LKVKAHQAKKELVAWWGEVSMRKERKPAGDIIGRLLIVFREPVSRRFWLAARGRGEK